MKCKVCGQTITDEVFVVSKSIDSQLDHFCWECLMVKFEIEKAERILKKQRSILIQRKLMNIDGTLHLKLPKSNNEIIIKCYGCGKEVYRGKEKHIAQTIDNFRFYFYCSTCEHLKQFCSKCHQEIKPKEAHMVLNKTFQEYCVTCALQMNISDKLQNTKRTNLLKPPKKNNGLHSLQMNETCSVTITDLKSKYKRVENGWEYSDQYGSCLIPLVNYKPYTTERIWEMKQIEKVLFCCKNMIFIRVPGGWIYSGKENVFFIPFIANQTKL